jgi:hypothetical protein
VTPHSPIPIYVVVVLSSIAWLARRRSIRATKWFIVTVVAMCALSALMIWVLVRLHVTH